MRASDRRRLALAAAALALALAAAPAAHAGTFEVHACEDAGAVWDNRSWTLQHPADGIGADQACPQAGHNIDLHVAPGARTPEGREARLAFHAPPGTTIADFRFARRLRFDNPTPDGAHRYYALYVLGDRVFAGAGNYHDATRDRLQRDGHWYGYPMGNADTGLDGVSRASFPSLAGYRGDATELSLRVGCWRRGSECGMAAGGRIDNALRGAAVVVNDPQAPGNLLVDSSGLLSGGPRHGSDPVRVRVTDNTGIRRVELVDVTDDPPRTVGAEDYDAGVADRPRRHVLVSPSGAVPRPRWRARRSAPRRCRPGGAGWSCGLSTRAATRPSAGRSPSMSSLRRIAGAPQRQRATETASIEAGFVRGARRGRRTIGFNSKADIAGRLLNANGQPIAGARVAVLTRDVDDDESVLRTTVVTDGDGRFAYRATAYASRLYQFAWASHANDVRYAANALRDPARARVRRPARAPRARHGVGERVVLTGRLLGKRPRRSVDIVAQGRAPGGRYRTFADGRVGRSGRFRLSYRFRDPGSRGRTLLVPHQGRARQRLRVLGRVFAPRHGESALTVGSLAGTDRQRREPLSYFVTGATGFIGRHLVERLLERDGDIHVLVREGSAEKLERLMRGLGRARPHQAGRRATSPSPSSASPTGTARRLRASTTSSTSPRSTTWRPTRSRTPRSTSAGRRTRSTSPTSSSRAASTTCPRSRWPATTRATSPRTCSTRARTSTHPYHRTKFESEKLVRERVEGAWRVYRPSIVVGNSKTGEMDKIDGPYYFFKAIQKVRHFAAGVVPADLDRVGQHEHRAGRLRGGGGRPHRPPGRP